MCSLNQRDQKGVNTRFPIISLLEFVQKEEEKNTMLEVLSQKCFAAPFHTKMVLSTPLSRM